MRATRWFQLSPIDRKTGNEIPKSSPWLSLLQPALRTAKSLHRDQLLSDDLMVIAGADLTRTRDGRFRSHTRQRRRGISSSGRMVNFQDSHDVVGTHFYLSYCYLLPGSSLGKALGFKEVTEGATPDVENVDCSSSSAKVGAS
jgi:hypothetical protein